VRDSESVVRKPRDCEDAVYFDSLDQMCQHGQELYYNPLNPVKMQVRQLVRNAQLSDRERNILCNKYDIMLTDEPLSTQELADHYHMTTQHVNRICRSAIDKLRIASVTA
jgi:DNA-directed RNA polymerase sigma subunit (sigma70/sigma32)